MNDGFVKANELLCIDLKHAFAVGSDRIKTLSEAFEASIDASPDGLIVPNPHPEALDHLYIKAQRRGIPIITYNSESNQSKALNLCFVGEDEIETGRALAERLLREFTPRRLLIPQDEPGESAPVQRLEGIRQVFEEKGVRIPIDCLDISVFLQNPAESIEVLRAYLIKNKDLQACICFKPEVAMGFSRIIEEGNYSEKVTILSTDLIPEMIESIRTDKILCGHGQQLFMQTYLSLILMYNYLRWGVLPPIRFRTGPVIIDKKSLHIHEKILRETGYS